MGTTVTTGAPTAVTDMLAILEAVSIMSEFAEHYGNASELGALE